MSNRTGTKRVLLGASALLCVAFLAACGDDATSENDGGSLDFGSDDAMTHDGGPGSDSVASDSANDSGGTASGDSGTSDGQASADGAVATACTRCHGSESNAAPPVNLQGLSDASLRGVGAHQSHLASSDWHAQVACTDCHIVPQDVAQSGHIDTALPAEVTFSELAGADGAAATWDGTTCATYCHGATLSGGSVTSPQWTKVDGTQAACGTCHSLPPTEGHPARTDCHSCHGAVVDADKKIIAPALHINGTVEVGVSHPDGYAAPTKHAPDFLADPTSCANAACHGTTLTGGSGPSCERCHGGWQTKCTFCHGGTDNDTGAPPLSTAGDTSSSVLAVGAHSEHVEDGASHLGFACSVCHPNRTSALDSGHLDDTPGDVTFSGLAAGASYDGSNGICSNVYCHGNGQSGSVGQAVWTGQLSGCDSCHSSGSLSGKHSRHSSRACNDCHGTTSTNTSISKPAEHLDGEVDLSTEYFEYDANTGTCSSVGACHPGETHPSNPRW